MNISDVRLCRQVILWQPMTTRDAFGKPTYGPAKKYRGRRSYKTVRIATKSGGGRGLRGEGTDVLSDSQIWIMAALPIGLEDRVYVKGDDPEKAPAIVSVGRIPDSSGIEKFTKIMLGSALG